MAAAGEQSFPRRQSHLSASQTNMHPQNRINMNGNPWKELCIGILLAGSGCADHAPDSSEDPEELQALLRDEPLTAPAIVRAARVSALVQPPITFTTVHWTFDDCDSFRAGLASASVPEDIAYRSRRAERLHPALHAHGESVRHHRDQRRYDRLRGVSGAQQSFLFRTVHLTVAEPTGCHVSKSRELFINDPSVINDPARWDGRIRRCRAGRVPRRARRHRR